MNSIENIAKQNEKGIEKLSLIENDVIEHNQRPDSIPVHASSAATDLTGQNTFYAPATNAPPDENRQPSAPVVAQPGIYPQIPGHQVNIHMNNPAPVTNQPQAAPTIINNCVGTGRGVIIDNRDRPFKHNICDCCGNCSVCLLSCCCAPIVLGQTASKSDCGNCFCVCCFSFMLPPVSCCILQCVRTEIRAKKRIGGNCCADLLLSWCCFCPTLIQSAREVDALGDSKEPTLTYM